MPDIVKDIEKFVRESAKKKKDQEKKQKVLEVNSFIQTAVSQRRQLEKEIKEKKTSYAFIILSVFGIVFYGLLIFSIYNYYKNSTKKVWIRTEVKPEDFTRVKAFTSELLAKSAAKKNVESFFNSQIPAPWKKGGLNILGSIQRGMKVEDVSLDKQTLGRKALFNVKCSGLDRTILVYVISEGGQESVLKINTADLNIMEEKNGKDTGNINTTAK